MRRRSKSLSAASTTDEPGRTPYLRLMASRPPHPDGSDRFQEDHATYAVRGSDQPDLAAGIAAIREVVRTLKPKPGVYRMHDARGDVLYVGKARVLKNRVANYVQVDRLSNRLRRMVGQTLQPDDRHHQFRGGSAVARGAADQALPPALQRAATRR